MATTRDLEIEIEALKREVEGLRSLIWQIAHATGHVVAMKDTSDRINPKEMKEIRAEIARVNKGRPEPVAKVHTLADALGALAEQRTRAQELNAKAARIARLKGDQKELYDMIYTYDGMEVPKSLWPAAEKLVKKGLIELGPARGPSKAWRRAIIVRGW